MTTDEARHTPEPWDVYKRIDSELMMLIVTPDFGWTGVGKMWFATIRGVDTMTKITSRELSANYIFIGNALPDHAGDATEKPGPDAAPRTCGKCAGDIGPGVYRSHSGQRICADCHEQLPRGKDFVPAEPEVFSPEDACCAECGGDLVMVCHCCTDVRIDGDIVPAAPLMALVQTWRENKHLIRGVKLECEAAYRQAGYGADELEAIIRAHGVDKEPEQTPGERIGT